VGLGPLRSVSVAIPSRRLRLPSTWLLESCSPRRFRAPPRWPSGKWSSRRGCRWGATCGGPFSARRGQPKVEARRARRRHPLRGPAAADLRSLRSPRTRPVGGPERNSPTPGIGRRAAGLPGVGADPHWPGRHRYLRAHRALGGAPLRCAAIADNSRGQYEPARAGAPRAQRPWGCSARRWPARAGAPSACGADLLG
jgi:hypothetical protein